MSPLTGVITESWRLYRRYAAHFLAIAFVLYLVTAVIVGVLTQFAGIGGQVVAEVIDLIAAFLIQAAMVKAVQDIRDGQADLTIGGTVSAAWPFVLPVAAASIMAGIGIAIGFAVIIVPGLILLTFWSLIVPSIVVGRSGVLKSFASSWRTIRGYAWHAFATYLLVFLIWVAFNIGLAAILLVLPTGLRTFVATVVAGTLVAPFYALVITLVYYRLSEAHAGKAPAAPAGGSFAPPGTPPPGGGITQPAAPQQSGGFAQPPPATPAAGA
jgi:hypothetical protein